MPTSRNSPTEAFNTLGPSRTDGQVPPVLGRERVRLSLGVLLTAAAGWVDAVGYLQLKGLYLSFMSGNSMELGVAAAAADWPLVATGAVLIALFLVGTLVGTVASIATGAWSLPTGLALEAGLLGAALWLSMAGWAPTYALAPIVLAMGLQNIVLQPLGGVRLGATFITGTLVSVGQEMGRALLGKSGHWAWGRHALVWAGLVLGATAGTTWAKWVNVDAVLPPAVLVAALAAACGLAIAIERRWLRPQSRGPMRIDGTPAHAIVQRG